MSALTGSLDPGSLKEPHHLASGQQSALRQSLPEQQATAPERDAVEFESTPPIGSGGDDPGRKKLEDPTHVGRRHEMQSAPHRPRTHDLRARHRALDVGLA